ncbi:ParA family protein [Deinococcus cavernae]|uniref:ParA family protein n=1 Tax=Deinococcus cavernae TaxID=2320857 RepID=UPI001F482C93|nr:ParA family protein [Deinococcus cavernae]
MAQLMYGGGQTCGFPVRIGTNTSRCGEGDENGNPLQPRGRRGETSITLNAGYELARSGARVLLIDLDPQANLTTWLGVDDVDLASTVHPVATEGKPLPKPVEIPSCI